MNSSPSKIAAYRCAKAKSLMIGWIRKNRPDIYEAAYKEAEKEFPVSHRRNSKKINLGILANIK